MAFTYDLTSNRGKVRLAIGDTVSGSGPRPANGNFTDAEIDVYLTPVIAASHEWRAAVAPLLRQLAVEWTHQANISIGEYSAQYGALAAGYREMAREWERTSTTAGAAATGGITAGKLALDSFYTVQSDGSVI